MFCVFTLNVMDSGCSLETLDGGFRLFIGDKVWGGVFTLEVVGGGGLFLHVNVFDRSLFTILIV